MKTSRIIKLHSLGLMTFLATSMLSDANPVLSASTVHPGGALQGGQFTLAGTLGQHDAGVATGGRLTLEGGFWNGIHVLQTSGAPILRITSDTNGMILLSWPVEAEGWTLQECSNLADGTWTNSRHPVVDTANEHTVAIPGSGPIHCYRLKK
jgi:hypothetical protein